MLKYFKAGQALEEESVSASASSCISPTILHQFQSLQLNDPALSDSQKSIIAAFMEVYAEPLMRDFISAAPDDLHPFRTFIIQQSSQLNPKLFEKLLAKLYPEVTPSSESYEQNMRFRSYLLAFNQLCTGLMDVNHNLFTSIFSKQLSSNEPDSPTKRLLVKTEIINELNKVFDFKAIEEDMYVVAGKNILFTLSQEMGGSARRRLRFD